MKTSTKGINLIKSFESLQLRPYYCPAGVLTVGYGHTGVNINPSIPISERYADELLSNDLDYFEKKITALNLNINQNQFDALVSFTFNVGFGNLSKSTLLKKVKINPNDETIAYEFSRWNKANRKVLPGLTRRRKEETNLYFL